MAEILSLGGPLVLYGEPANPCDLDNRHFRLVTTHLQGPVPGDPAVTVTQTAQANQLIQELRNSTDPVVIAGDFNSDAILGVAGSGPDNTDTAALIQAAGYVDTWVHPEAGHSGPLAAEGVCALLDVEIAPWSWKARSGCHDSRFD